MKCPKCQFENPADSSFCSKCGTKFDLSKPVRGTGPTEEISVSHTKTLQIPMKELSRGSTFAGRYEIIEELGRGGMGRVYKVLDKEIKEEVALKLLNPEIAVEEKTIERFRIELKLARKVTHNSVCRMHDINKEEGTYYITMEYVPGEDLKSFIRRGEKLTVGKAISIAKQVCEGLAEAHRLGVIHRDLKPQNIMIDRKGNAKIMDFGIARSVETKGVTETGMIIGTPDYMSPEQAEVKEVDQRSDIYSLGVILYEMVTGRVPFEGETPLSIAIKHKTEAPKDPKEVNSQIPEDLSRVILRCMEKDREKRYQSAEEFLSELSNIEKGIPIKKTKAEIVSEIKWKNSIAVLPFADLSPQKDQEYFCDGMAEELINSLTKIMDLRVVARTSAFSFKGKDVDIREIGEKLNVEMVLEGSVRKADNRLRITAQLISVADGYHLWSERYDRKLDDVFVIQDEVTLAIVDKLKVKLLGKEKARLVKRHTEDAEAYNLYLKGLYFLNKRTGEGIKKGIEYFQKAIENDPRYALAYTGLADSYSIFGFYGFISPKDAFPKAKAAAQKALELDDALAAAHTSLGYINIIYDWDWSDAENRIKRAIELNPGYAQAHHWYAAYLAIVGHFEESIAEIKQALELDPLSLRLHTELGNYLRWSGRLDEALEQLRKTLEMDPNFGLAHIHIGLVYALMGRYEEAIPALQRAVKLTGGSPIVIGSLGSTYAMSGEREKAEKILHELEEKAKERYVSPFYIAVIYHALGELDKTFEWCEKAYEERDTMMSFLKTWPEFEGLRSDPRGKAFLKKMGLEK